MKNFYKSKHNKIAKMLKNDKMDSLYYLLGIVVAAIVPLVLYLSN